MATAADIRANWHLVRYAECAYDDGSGCKFRRNFSPDELQGPLNVRKVQSNGRWSHNHVHLGIGQQNNLVIAFRGTDFPSTIQNVQEIERWLGFWINAWTDVRYSLVHPFWIENPNVLVHEGFFRDFVGLIHDLENSINVLMHGRAINSIETCGHSLGGALATLCASWCSMQYLGLRITCLTLGSPRVGNQHFAGLFRPPAIRPITCYRLFIPTDPIPTVPNRLTQTAFFLRRYPGPQRWRHVGLPFPVNWPVAFLPALLRPLVRVWQTGTLAAHHPWNYAEGVQLMLAL